MAFESTTQPRMDQAAPDARRESHHRTLACTVGMAVLVLGFIAAGWPMQAATLERYNALIGQFQAAGQRTEQAANAHLQSEAAKLDKLKGMLNPP